MDIRLLRAVRCQVEICRRAPDNSSEGRRSGSSRPARRLHAALHLIKVAAILTMQRYQRARGRTPARGAAFIVSKRSKKAAAALAYLSEIFGGPLSFVACRFNARALAAAFDIHEAKEYGLRFRPFRFIKALRSVTGSLDGRTERRVIALLFAYWNFRMVFGGWCPAFIICLSDFSPRRLAAGCAANAAKLPVLFFQDDWHHDLAPPFETAAASVLNRTGLTAVRQSMRADGIVTLRREELSVPAIRSCRRSIQRLGIALNNLFNLGELVDLAQKLADGFPDAEIIVRKHPRSKTQLKRLRGNITEAPAGQSITDFAADCDIVLVGNSAVQIGLLLAGLPVVHVGHLDKLKFDYYGYVSSGVVYGAEVFESLEVDAINRFYSDGAWRPRFLGKLDLADVDERGIMPEEALAQWMETMLNAAGGDATATSWPAAPARASRALPARTTDAVRVTPPRPRPETRNEL